LGKRTHPNRIKKETVGMQGCKAGRPQFWNNPKMECKSNFGEKNASRGNESRKKKTNRTERENKTVPLAPVTREEG